MHTSADCYLQAFFYACGMFSGTISGLLGELTEKTLGDANTVNTELSLCDFFHERCWGTCWLEMGMAHSYALPRLPERTN